MRACMRACARVREYTERFRKEDISKEHYMVYVVNIIRHGGHKKSTRTSCDNLCQTIHSHNCLPTSPLYRVLQFSVGRSGVVLLLLLAIFCCQFAETSAAEGLRKLALCVQLCNDETVHCVRHCHEDTACARFIKLCEELCFSADKACDEKCFKQLSASMSK